MDFLHAAQDFRWMLVDGQCAAGCQTEARPCTFKDVGKRQEVHNHVFFAQRNGMFMGTEGRQIHSMGHHHTLAQSRSATGIEDTGQIILVIFSSAVFHLCLMLQGFAHLQKLIKIQAHLILRILHHRRVKDD